MDRLERERERQEERGRRRDRGREREREREGERKRGGEGEGERGRAPDENAVDSGSRFAGTVQHINTESSKATTRRGTNSRMCCSGN